MFQIVPTQPTDAPTVEWLLDLSFGPDRKAKASYRFREGVLPQPGLSFLARRDDGTGQLLGTVACWPIAIAGPRLQSSLLLGPLGIHPDWQGRGVGRSLMWRLLVAAMDQGHGSIFLVGDVSYYQRFGFERAPACLVMPGEVPSRLLVRALRPGGLEGLLGALQPWRSVRTASLNPATIGLPRPATTSAA